MSQRILLTGAAGLLGSEIAGRLLDRGYGVTGLVNRNRDVRRNDGSPIRATEWVETPPAPGEFLLLSADLREDRFGWSAERWAGVAAAHDVIVHAAAVTQFDADAAVHRAVNVDGTARVLELAHAGGMNLVHVSTAYVCGKRDGPIMEGELDVRQDFANGYEASKAAAEALVRASPVPAAIARPSIVVGDHATGAIRSFDTIYAVLKLFAEGRIRTMPAAAGATLDLVPLDHVANGIVDLVDRLAHAAGGTFHLVSGAPTPVTAFPETLADYPGLACPTLVDPATFDADKLPPVERRFFARGAALYAGYFTRDPRFDDTGFRKLTGRACPPVDRAYWHRLVDHAIHAGFIRPRRVARP